TGEPGVVATERDHRAGDGGAAVLVGHPAGQRTLGRVRVRRGREVLDRRGVVAVDSAGEPAHAAGGEDLPDLGLVLAAVDHEVGLQDRVALVQHGRVGRRELHRPGHQGLGLLGTQHLAQIPQRLAPDLAVGVHLGPADDPAEVAVGVTAGAGAGRARAQRRRAANGAVHGLGTDEVVAPTDVVADPDVTIGGRVRLESLVVEEVHRVPVAPRLAHRTGLDVAERRYAIGVDDQAVGQAVGVLVVDDVRLVAGVAGDERVTVRERGPR